MPRLPGKPYKVDRKLAISALKKKKSGIILPNNKVVSKLDPIWHLISKDLNNQLSARTLYSMVCKVDVRRAILCATPEGDQSCINESNVSATSLQDTENDSSIEPGSITFTI
jgi:hypothetical protein